MHQTASAVLKLFPLYFNSVLVIASEMLVELESEKLAKNVDFNTAKNVQTQATLFCCCNYFRTNSYNVNSDLFIVV